MYNKDGVVVTETVDAREGRGYVYDPPLPEDIDHLSYLYTDKDGYKHFDVYTSWKDNRLWGSAILKGSILYCD